MGCVLLCQQALEEEKFVNMEREGKFCMGLVLTLQDLSGEGHVDCEASFNHITFAYQDMNWYAVATIAETLLLCNVYEWGRRYDRMNVVGVLHYQYFGCAALLVLYVRCVISTLCALRCRYFVRCVIGTLYICNTYEPQTE